MDSTINNALTLRQATLMDLDFLVRVDRKDEGDSSAYMNGWGPKEIAEHRDKVAAFVLADDKAAWVFEDTEANRLVGTILWRYRNRLSETFEAWSVIGQLDKSLFPPDGAFCENLSIVDSPGIPPSWTGFQTQTAGRDGIIAPWGQTALYAYGGAQHAHSRDEPKARLS